MSTEISYPKFIADQPLGEDRLISKSQEKLAKEIYSYIRENNQSKRRVIGINGEWGSGKSNMLEILKRECKNDFHVFTFDAWGHQEDLTRRAVLEELVDDLVDSKILKEEWDKNLQIELASNVYTTQKNIPQFNNKLIIFTLALLASPLFEKVINWLIGLRWDAEPFVATLWTIGLFTLTFLILFIFGKKKVSLAEVLFLYKGNDLVTTKHETIQSLEPTVRTFKKILRLITDNMQVKKNLVIVIDNMDRLPSKNVKEIWSSIHTFFQTRKT
ncbi:MAG: P-loop NTPase fold protein [Chitinophagaceae bacterium]